MIIIVPNPADIAIAKVIADKDVQKYGIYYLMALGGTTIGLTNSYTRIPELQFRLKDDEQCLVKYAISQWNIIQQNQQKQR